MFTAIILTFRRLKPEDYKFEAKLYYLKPTSEKAKIKEKKEIGFVE